MLELMYTQPLQAGQSSSQAHIAEAWLEDTASFEKTAPTQTANLPPQGVVPFYWQVCRKGSLLEATNWLPRPLVMHEADSAPAPSLPCDVPLRHAANTAHGRALLALWQTLQHAWCSPRPGVTYRAGSCGRQAAPFPLPTSGLSRCTQPGSRPCLQHANWRHRVGQV